MDEEKKGKSSAVWVLLVLAITGVTAAISVKEQEAEQERLRRVRAEIQAETRDRMTALDIEEGKIYCIWGKKGFFDNGIPSCVFVPKKR